jgi:hypothetical protein
MDGFQRCEIEVVGNADVVRTGIGNNLSSD